MNAVPACGCAVPGAVDPATCYCSVEDLLRILRRRYSLAVMRVIHARPEAHYRHISAGVPEISSSTLAETLRALEAARLLTRDLDPTGHPLYSLSASGSKLLSRLRGLLEDVQTR